MNKLLKQILILICLIAVLILPYFVFAQETPLGKLESVGQEGGYAQADKYTISKNIVGPIIQAALSLIGVIFLVLMIYGGYSWMTAHGNEEQVTKAKNIITRAMIGLIIVVAAYAIATFVTAYLITESGALK